MSAQSKMSAELFRTDRALAVTFESVLISTFSWPAGIPGIIIFDQYGFWTTSNEVLATIFSTL